MLVTANYLKLFPDAEMLKYVPKYLIRGDAAPCDFS